VRKTAFVISLALLLLTSNAQSIVIRSIGDHFVGSHSNTSSGVNYEIDIVTQGRTASEAFSSVRALIRSGNHEALNTLANHVLQSQADAGLAYEVLGIAHFMAGREAQAIAAFDRATQLEPDQSGPWTKKGILLLAQDETEAAFNALSKSISVNADDRHAHQRLGMIHQRRGEFGSAVKHYRLGLKGTKNDYLGVAVELASLLNAGGRYQDTVTLLEPRLTLESTVESAQISLAKAYLETRRLEDAEKRYRRAIELAPLSNSAHLGLAAVLREGGNAADSLRKIEAILAKDSKSIRAHLEHGATLFALGHTGSSRSAFNQAIALGADEQIVLRRFATLLESKQDYEAASDVYQELVAKNAADGDTYSRLSNLHLLSGDAIAAKATLRSAMQKYPNNAFLHWRMGSLLASIKAYADATTELRMAHQLEPQNRAILQTYSLALSRMGAKEDAANVAQKMYLLNTNDTAAAEFYALRLIDADQERKAEKVFRNILVQQPTHAMVKNNLAFLLQQRGLLTEAQTLAAEANQALPKNAQILDTLGWIQHQLGNSKQSLETLNRATRFAPNLASAHYHRSEVLFSLGREKEASLAQDKARQLEKR